MMKSNTKALLIEAMLEPSLQKLEAVENMEKLNPQWANTLLPWPNEKQAQLPLEILLSQKYSRDQNKIISFLLKHGAEPSALRNDSHKNKRFTHLTDIECLPLAQYYVSQGMDPNIRNLEGHCIASFWTVNRKKVEVNAFFSWWHSVGGDIDGEYQIDVDGKSGYGLEQKQRSLLWRATEVINPQAVSALLKLGANPNKATLSGRTPLFEAIDNLTRVGFRGRPQKIISLLIEGGADVNHLDEKNERPEARIKRIAWNLLPEWELLKTQALEEKETKIIRKASRKLGAKVRGPKRI